MEYTGTIPPDPLILPDAAQSCRPGSTRWPTQIPVDAPWTRPTRRASGTRCSVDQWLRENTVNPDVRNLLLSYLQPAFGSDGLDMSLLFFLWYIATAGNETQRRHLRALLRHRATARRTRRFVGGSQLVPLRLAEPARLTGWRSTAPVRADRAAPRPRAVVHTDRGTVRARRVVVAVPAGAGARHRLVPAAARRGASSCCSGCRWAR